MPDSEFVRLVMDEELRGAPAKYATFARHLLDKRFEGSGTTDRSKQEGGKDSTSV